MDTDQSQSETTSAPIPSKHPTPAESTKHTTEHEVGFSIVLRFLLNEPLFPTRDTLHFITILSFMDN